MSADDEKRLPTPLNFLYLNTATYATAKNPQGNAGGTLTSSVDALVAKHAVLDKLKTSSGAWNNKGSTKAYFAGFKNGNAAAGGASVLSQPLEGEDSPGNGPPLTYQEALILPLVGKQDLLTHMSYEEDFELDICAQTLQGPSNIYVRRATAAWSFVAEGKENPQQNYVFVSDKDAGGNDVTKVILPASGAWTLVPPGNWQPSQIGGTIMNDITGKPEKFLKS